MSNISIEIRKQSLFLEEDVPLELARILRAQFVAGVKSLFGEHISNNYDVSYKTAMTILKIRETEHVYSIYIDSPENYPGKLKLTVKNMLINDLGSVTEKISPTYILKKFSELISETILILWKDFVRDRSEEIDGSKQHHKAKRKNLR